MNEATAPLNEAEWCLTPSTYQLLGESVSTIQQGIYKISVKQREVGQPTGDSEYRYWKEMQEWDTGILWNWDTFFTFYGNEILVCSPDHPTSQHLHHLPICCTHVQFCDTTSITIKIRETLSYSGNTWEILQKRHVKEKVSYSFNSGDFAISSHH